MNNINTRSPSSCYTNLLSAEDEDQITGSLSLQMYSNNGNIPSSSSSLPPPHHPQTDPQYSTAATSSSLSSILYTLSILKHKVHQLQSLAAVLLSPPPAEANSMAMAGINMSNAIQDIIQASSSMLLTFQQMGLLSTTNQDHKVINNNPQPTNFYSTTETVWFGTNTHDDEIYNNTITTTTNNNTSSSIHNTNNKNVIITQSRETKRSSKNENNDNHNNFDIIELEAADLLAKYTHYCQVCGKGFKRDANLRMHMRAHGDEYKTSAALSNPTKNNINNDSSSSSMVMISSNDWLPKKYSCPQEGCRWNKRHAKFQPLKSMICVKNHYKRSHCPKMYVCKRCTRKQFSVLSDLRTHEKHCGDLKWQCSCGTTFSRKDKLMGHVALFLGHTPLTILSSSSSSSGVNNNSFKSVHLLS